MNYKESPAIKGKKKSKMKNMEPKNIRNNSDDDEDPDYPQNRFSSNHTTVLAKTKKMKKFVVNTRHCRQERETLQYVIDLCRWYETTNIGDGNLIWYGVSLRD